MLAVAEQVDTGGHARAVATSARAANEPDPWGLNPEATPAPVVKAPAKKKPAAPPDPGHQRCVDAYHDAFLARVGQRPIVGSREAGAIKRLRESFRALKKTDDDLIAWLRAFYADDWRAETTSIAQLSADPTRYLKMQQRFKRAELGAGMQRADDNMPTRYYRDEDFK